MKGKMCTALKTLVLVSLLIGFLHLPAGVMTHAAPSPQAGEQPMEALLKADGSLDLTTGFSGSLDAAGWRMTTAEDGAPRFRNASVGFRLAAEIPFSTEEAEN